MGVETLRNVIGGHEYKLETFGARQGMSVAMTLVRFLGPTMAQVLGANNQVQKAAKAVRAGLGVAQEGDVHPEVQDVEILDQDLGEALSRGIQAFATTARDEDFQAVVGAFIGKCKLVQPLTTKDGPKALDVQLTPDNFDRHFAGRYRDLIQWLVWCVKGNFADFFGKSGNASPGVPQVPTL